VRIKDSGIGIGPDELDSIFGMFTQVERTRDRSQGGLGIGLTLARRLVEMHGGAVQAFSEGLGRGSEFVIWLPIPSGAPSRQERSASSGTDRPVLTARRILVVDDNEDSAISLATLLSLTGNETHIAHNGLEAVEAAETFRPNIVLLDIGMPRLNGCDTARKMREQPWGRNIVLVATTGWGQEKDRDKSKEAGIDAHMVKPVNFDELITLLASLTEQKAST
jgi:CheY-like chemotaxis protein